MPNVKVDFQYSGVKSTEISKYQPQVTQIHEDLKKKANLKKEFVGWLKLPTKYDKKEFERIKEVAEKIKEDSEVFVVIGIGGSYLGARAVIEALTGSFTNLLTKKQRKAPQIFFAGNNISPNYLNEIIEIIGDKDVSINVISKSGTTLESAIAFRVFREFLESKYGIEEARERIYVTTDKKKGSLKLLADEEEYETFVIPNNIGGRYSVLTPVGLLPIAVAGIDIDKLMEGALSAERKIYRR